MNFGSVALLDVSERVGSFTLNFIHIICYTEFDDCRKPESDDGQFTYPFLVRYVDSIGSISSQSVMCEIL